MIEYEKQFALTIVEAHTTSKIYHQSTILKMTADKIEQKAVNSLEFAILNSDILKPHFKENDKGISWDGYIDLFEKDTSKKTNLIGSVKVQIKGEETDDFSKEEIKKEVKVDDLKNYFKMEGTIYFVVYLNATQFQIYYVDLSPVKLSLLLEKAGSQKNINVALSKFPEDKRKMEMILFSAFDNYNKQHSFKDNLLPISEITKNPNFENEVLNIPTSPGMDMKTALLAGETYLYAKYRGIPTLVPVKEQPLKNPAIITNSKINVSVGDETYYTQVKKIETEQNTYYEFGNTFTFSPPIKGEMIFRHKISSNLREFVLDQSFLISALENGSFTFNSIEIELENSEEKKTLSEKKERINYFKKIEQLLDFLHCHKDIDINKLTEDDWDNIDFLLHSLIDKKPLVLSEKQNDFFTTKIENLQFLLLAYKDSEGENLYKIKDFFEEPSNYIFRDQNGEPILVPKFLFLTADNLIKFENVRCDSFLKWLSDLDCNPAILPKVNLFLLELIKAYDFDNSRVEFIHAALSISVWLMKKDTDKIPPHIKLINKLQIKKRIDKISDKEMEELQRIAETPGIGEDIKTGAYILLGNMPGAKVHFEQMNEQEQAAFKKYPIYHLWPK